MRRLQSAKSKTRHLSATSLWQKPCGALMFPSGSRSSEGSLCNPFVYFWLHSEGMNSILLYSTKCFEAAYESRRSSRSFISAPTLSHLILSTKLLKAGHFLNFIMKKSGSEKSVIWHSWADNARLPQTPASSTMFRCSGLWCLTLTIAKGTAFKIRHWQEILNTFYSSLLTHLPI